MVRGRKHPHARGEDRMGCCHFRLCQETPPRTWGRHGGNRGGAMATRNTPTHVGKTGHCRGIGNTGQKHPHARGEDERPSMYNRRPWETPPRTWGRPGRFHQSNYVCEKHPHARGEDTWNLLAFFLLTFNKELGRHLNQKLKIFPFGRNTGLQAKKSNSSVDESLSPQCTWL